MKLKGKTKIFELVIGPCIDDGKMGMWEEITITKCGCGSLVPVY